VVASEAAAALEAEAMQIRQDIDACLVNSKILFNEFDFDSDFGMVIYVTIIIAITATINTHAPTYTHQHYDYRCHRMATGKPKR
jgi:hypothetical protein